MKALIINNCYDCPHVGISCPDKRDDMRIVFCEHPEAPDHDGQDKKLNHEWGVMNFCPLPNYNPDGTDTAT